MYFIRLITLYEHPARAEIEILLMLRLFCVVVGIRLELQRSLLKAAESEILSFGRCKMQIAGIER